MKHTLSINEGRVLSLIPKTSENPIIVNDIVKITGIERRTVQGIIETLAVRYGIPIVSIRGGYTNKKGIYIATNVLERDEGLISLKSQVVENKKRIEAVESADLKKWHENIQFQAELVNEHAEELEEDI